MAIDMDKARAARAEAEGRKPTVVFGGKKFKLPVELPLDTMDAIARLGEASTAKDGVAITAAFREIAVSLVGDRADEFMALQPSVQDMSALVEGIAEEYGFSVGESEASAAS